MMAKRMIRQPLSQRQLFQTQFIHSQIPYIRMGHTNERVMKNKLAVQFLLTRM
jgi:hypothetical protein